MTSRNRRLGSLVKTPGHEEKTQTWSVLGLNNVHPFNSDFVDGIGVKFLNPSKSGIWTILLLQKF